MKDLKVYYKYEEGVNSEFDKEIDELAKNHGLTFSGSGFNYEDKVRDLHYERKK